MPNGGSDCCGTCWFNARNRGEAGYDRADEATPNYCTIRDLAIDDPFYTYCGNHPHRRPQRDPVPIGPVFRGAGRLSWKPSPDSETIRRHLLDLLEQVGEQPSEAYPIGYALDEIVVSQLGEFREARALPALERIAAFDPGTGAEDPLGRTRERLAEAARAAMRLIAQVR
jgi:hypothetical protein